MGLSLARHQATWQTWHLDNSCWPGTAASLGSKCLPPATNLGLRWRPRGRYPPSQVVTGCFLLQCRLFGAAVRTAPCSSPWPGTSCAGGLALACPPHPPGGLFPPPTLIGHSPASENALSCSPRIWACSGRVTGALPGGQRPGAVSTLFSSRSCCWGWGHVRDEPESWLTVLLRQLLCHVSGEGLTPRPQALAPGTASLGNPCPLCSRCPR